MNTSSRFATVVAGAAALAAFTFTQDAAAVPSIFHAEWRGSYASNDVVKAMTNFPLCRWNPTINTSSSPYKVNASSLFVGNAFYSNNKWHCGGKTSGFSFLDKIKVGSQHRYGYAMYSSASDIRRANTVIDELANRGLCMAKVGTQWVSGYVYRGDKGCNIKVLGKMKRMTTFKYVVTPSSSMPTTNGFFQMQPHMALFSSFRVGTNNAQTIFHKETYLCQGLSTGNKTWFGQTFYGKKPGTSAQKHYCRIVKSDNGTTATYSYIPATYATVYLNNRPTKAGAAVWAGSAGPGSLLKPSGNNVTTCKKGDVLGVKIGSGPCRYPVSPPSKPVRYLWKRN